MESTNIKKKKKNTEITDTLNASVEAMKRAMKSASDWKWSRLAGDEFYLLVIL